MRVLLESGDTIDSKEGSRDQQKSIAVSAPFRRSLLPVSSSATNGWEEWPFLDPIHHIVGRPNINKLKLF